LLDDPFDLKLPAEKADLTTLESHCCSVDTTGTTPKGRSDSKDLLKCWLVSGEGSSPTLFSDGEWSDDDSEKAEELQEAMKCIGPLGHTPTDSQ
ncbi:Hypothetical predicted protein, partial [Pelobates cultripes]